jgi:sigma-B regulation protein RsbU (phosphoserine phosphatase)
VPFGPGDTCLLYTDGLVETADARGDAFGAARLAATLARLDPAIGASPLVTAILAEVDRHRAGAAQQDDVTVVALVAH